MASEPVQKKPSFFKFLIPVAVILGLIFVALQVIKSTTSKPETGSVKVAIGETLPDFTLNTLDQKEVRASAWFAETKSKLVLINFWATWCEACIAEMPSIVAMREKFKSQGVEVLGISVDENPASVVPKAAKELKMEFPLFFDKGGDLSDLFNVNAIPLSVVLDKNLKILFIHPGEENWNSPEMQEQIKRWLGGL